MIDCISKLKRADPQNENGKVGGLTKAMINRIELSAKMFRRICQTALWCCCSCNGIERQGQSAIGQL